MDDQLEIDFSTDAGHRTSATNVDRPGLRVGGYLTIQERFEEWLDTPEGRTVYSEVLRRARALHLRGWKHYGVKALVEAIRYDRDVRIGPNDGGFKINDHYSSRIARKAMLENPLLEGFFEVRSLRETGDG